MYLDLVFFWILVRFKSSKKPAKGIGVTPLIEVNKTSGRGLTLTNVYDWSYGFDLI